MQQKPFKKKKFRITKELVWKVIIVVSSILLITMSFAPLLLMR